MGTTKRIRRRVVSAESWYNPGHEKHWAVGGGYSLILECGHTGRRKHSQGVPKTMFCRECENLRNGGSSWTGEQDGICETWDEETQMPRREPMTREEYDRKTKGFLDL